MSVHVHCKGLLDLADSYCEKQLKKICERLLWQRVSIDNVMSLITVAYKYKAEVCVTHNSHITYTTSLVSPRDQETLGLGIGNVLFYMSSKCTSQSLWFHIIMVACTLCTSTNWICLCVCTTAISIDKVFFFVHADTSGILLQVCVTAHDTGYVIRWLCRSRWNIGQGVHSEGCSTGYIQNLIYNWKEM